MKKQSVTFAHTDRTTPLNKLTFTQRSSRAKATNDGLKLAGPARRLSKKNPTPPHSAKTHFPSLESSHRHQNGKQPSCRVLPHQPRARRLRPRRRHHTILNSLLYTIDSSRRAVLFDRFRGVIDDTIGEGTHFLIPWLQKPYIFDIRTRPHTFSSISGTKDLQMVNLTLRVLSCPEVSRLPQIFKTLGLEYDKKVLPSIGNEVLKAVVAQFNVVLLASEALMGREYDEKINVWSVGVMMYIMLDEIPPFYGKSATEIFQAVLQWNLRFSPKVFRSVSPAAKDLLRKKTNLMFINNERAKP